MSMETSPTLSASPTAATWLQRGFLAAVILGSAAAMSPNQADPDLWGHVWYGVDALRDGLATTTTYSYTAEGYRWINHENLAEVAFAVVAMNFGPVGLLLMKFAFSLAILGMIAYWGVHRRVSLLALSAALVITAINLAYWWAVRPQMFTFLYTAMLLFLLSWCFEGWEGRWHLPWLKKIARDDTPASEQVWFNSRRLRWLWLGPVIIFFATNTHGGFLACAGIFCAIVGLRAIEAALTRGRAATGVVLRFALMIAAACAVTLINPYSWRLHEWLLVSLRAPRPEIGEWTSLKLTAECFVPFIVLTGTMLASFVFSRRPLDATHLVVLGLVTWQAITHERHTAFLALLFGFWLPPQIDSFFCRIRLTQPDGPLSADASPKARWALAAGLCLVFLVLGARLYQRLSDMPVDKNKWPVAAMQYIADQHFKGKLLVTFNWAQYAIAALGPTNPALDDGLLVQFDGRYDTCYPFEIVDLHFDFILGDNGPGSRYRGSKLGPTDGSLALKFMQPDLLLLSRRQPHAQEVLQRHAADWVLLYQDEIAQVWGRRAKFDNPASPDYVPLARREISDAPQNGSVTWPALPRQRGQQVGANVKRPFFERMFNWSPLALWHRPAANSPTSAAAFSSPALTNQ